MAAPSPNATNPESKFESFSLSLSNGGITSGISYIPPHSPSTPSRRPLIVALHGGTCTAHNYDVDPQHTAYLASSALSVPFVAINRPAYQESSPAPFSPDDKDNSFHRATGMWEHEFIFPAIWERFGLPNGCTGMVITAHSMAVPGATVAASLWAKETSPQYPLKGLIFSGWGTGIVEHESMQPVMVPGEEKMQMTQFKKLMMLGEDAGAAYEPEIVPLVEKQDVAAPILEIVDGRMLWPQYGPAYAKEVNVPIMYGMGEHDWLWRSGKQYIKEFEEWFPKCPRFDGSTVLGAPHAIEWGRTSQGWYVRCFGFAMEVCAASKT